MHKQLPVLAQNGNVVGLALLPIDSGCIVGSTFDRDPVIHKRGKWTVIKVFDGDAGVYVRAIIDIMGLHAVEPLFQIEVQEQAMA